MTRHGRIALQLDWCVSKGILRNWYSQSDPVRWTLEGIGFHTRVYSTAEVEAFVLGASEGRTTGILDGGTVNA